ncbi:SAM-dependent methyltransferase [Oceanibacterium hippocampi]|uniref:Dimethylglycine N-methyltransferase n=1 Tax=Oceanibacterium hippocampi TaxID=745714 RepID=A0A1Y5S9X2_9PROT|nr:methyltransferase domain-containing protein [Oceanibacterium hippocampi]SLN35124.1 Dimethylglycine N-methyltransferase [Oceanibacterium hippocampi]
MLSVLSKSGKTADGVPRKRARPPLGKRLRAWWEGYDLDEDDAGGDDDAGPFDAEGGDDAEERRAAGWAPSRLEALQTLFGEGMAQCCDEEAMERLTTPLGLDETSRVCEIGAGLGGYARYIVKETQAWVTGYEETPELAAAGHQLSVDAGLGTRAAIEPVDFSAFEPKQKSVDAVVSQDAIFTMADKKAVFSAISGILKPGGQVMITDYLLSENVVGDSAVAEWAAREPKPVHLITLKQYRELLFGIDLNVRVCEEITDDYKEWITAAFADFAARLTGTEISSELRNWVLEETEHWLTRLRLMDEGKLRVYRFYGAMPAE